MVDVIYAEDRYQLHVMLLDVGPAPWRRLLIRPDTTIDELHRLIQRCMDWDEQTWHSFRIHGAVQFGRRRGYGGSDPSGTADTALSYFCLIPGERFSYDYGGWRCQLRLEKVMLVERPRFWPICIGGKWGTPPEWCGSGQSYMTDRQRIRHPFEVIDLLADLLADILPLEHRLSPRSVRRQLHRVANCLEGDLGDEIGMINTQPSMPDGKDRPPAPMTVGLDGGYVHAREGSNRKAGWFEVMVGKSVPDIGDAKCFAMVQSLDTRPRRRLSAVLDAQGLARGQSIHFVSDGGDTVRNLQLRLHGEAEHWLDWFHITMRITVMRQMAKSIVSIDTTDLADRIDRELARIKWLLWHGNHVDGAEAADLLTWDLELADNKEAAAKLEKTLGEFSVYIRRNADFIANYGDKWRNGERISSGFTESAVNQVLSRRMVKKQQMRWTKVGAHLLLQTRTQTLNGDLRRCFQRWYPDMKSAA